MKTRQLIPCGKKISFFVRIKKTTQNYIPWAKRKVLNVKYGVTYCNHQTLKRMY
jgi:hypothetical protein